jgi:hypothetical protein
MPRGRRAKSQEVKALLGNPGKRKLALSKVTDGKKTRVDQPRSDPLQPPDYLSLTALEAKIFRRALSALPANIIRSSDLDELGRWAYWLAVWVESKKMLEGKANWYESKSKHGTFLREHPVSKRMHQAEAHLIGLEDRLCLNVPSRNSIVHKMFQMPAQAPAAEGLFSDEAITEELKNAPGLTAADTAALTPLNFLSQAGKQFAAKLN